MNMGGHSYNFVLDWQKLMPGDIILSRETLAMKDVLRCPGRIVKAGVSGTVRAVTGEYSHAMIYFDKSIIHAEKPGVFSLNPQRVSVAAKEDLYVLRYPGLTDKMKEGLETFCRANVGSLYDTREAILVPFAKAGAKAPDARQFCSRLVAQAYASVGIRLVGNPDYCAPSEFIGASALTFVGHCSRRATEGDLAILHSRDFVQENLCHTFAWLAAARDYAAKDGVFVQTVEDVVGYLMGHRAADKIFADALQSSGNLEDWREEKVAHPFRYHPGLLSIAVQQGLTSVAQEAEMCQIAFDRYEQMLQAIKAQLTIFPASQFLELYKTLYRDMIGDLQNRAAVLCALLVAGQPMTPNPARLYASCSTALSAP